MGHDIGPEFGQVLVEVAEPFLQFTLQGHALAQQVDFCCNRAPSLRQFVGGGDPQLIKQLMNQWVKDIIF